MIVKAKSPLIETPVKFRGEVPVLVSVTALAGLVVPTSLLGNVSEDGTRLTTGPFAVTVSDTVVVCVKLPDTPVIVTVDLPSAAPDPTVKVSVLVVVVGFGLNAAVTPFGRPDALNVTLLLKPFVAATVIVLVPVAPCATDNEFGAALRLKSGIATMFTGTAFDSMPFATTVKL